MKTVYLLGSSRIQCEPGGKANTFKAETSDLKNYINPRALRRVDGFTRMALLSVYRALEQTGISLETEKTGLILGSVNGPVNATLRFLDDLIDDGDEFASPTWFSTSIHNAMAAQIALKLNIQGPTRTITADSETLELTLQNAKYWLEKDICEIMIVCIGDEASDLLASEQGQHDGFVCYILGTENSGKEFPEIKIQPEHFKPFTYPTAQAEDLIS